MQLTSLAAACVAAQIFLASPCNAASTLTAICKDPVGRVLGFTGKESGSKFVDQVEGMQGGQFTFIWSVGERYAQMIAMGSGGAQPTTEEVLATPNSAGMVSFIALYERAIWTHTLFLDARLLVTSQHVDGFYGTSGGALVKAMLSACSITAQ